MKKIKCCLCKHTYKIPNKRYKKADKYDITKCPICGVLDRTINLEVSNRK